MIEYSIRFNVDVAKAMSPYFDFEHLWRANPHGAIEHSASIAVGCDARMNSSAIRGLTVQRYLQVLLSAIPRTAEYGSIIGFSRAFFRMLRNNNDVDALVEVTNHVFKNLALKFDSSSPLLSDRTLRLSRELHYLANVELHSIRSSDPVYERMPRSLNRALHAVDRLFLPNSIVFTFITQSYLDNFELWLDLYLRHDIEGKHLLVIAIGDGFAVEVTSRLQQRGASKGQVVTFDPPFKLGVCGNGMDLEFLWYLKVHVVAELLNRGHRVVYSDLDAYWVKNYFAVREGACDDERPDVIVSLTRDMPRAAVSHWGFTPCAGFFSAEPTDAGKAFLEEWRQMTEVMFDDQIALAEILLRQNATWEQVNSENIGAVTRCVTKTGIDVKLAMLDEDTARRVGLPNIDTVGNATIWHPRWISASETHKSVIDHLVRIGANVLP